MTGKYQRNLAPYSSMEQSSRGRLFDEEKRLGCSEFQRDRDRIIHSAAFRRLEYKTQVFISYQGDHYRTRLTHSLEVAQLARCIARELGLDEDLSEAIALSHDLGHTPFGHAGEQALAIAMKEYGGFDHNAHSLRILTYLESKYINFKGLNLTWECLEGIAKHNGCVTSDVPRALKAYNDSHDLELHTHPSLEAQITAICDDIAYNNHDIEDGIKAGLFGIQDIKELPLIGEIYHNIIKNNPDIASSVLIHEAKRSLINQMVKDLVKTTQNNLLIHSVKCADDVRKQNIARFSSEMQNICLAIKEFLGKNMYQHYKVNRMTSKARRVIKELFEVFFAEPELLPTSWQNEIDTSGEKAVTIADYIAGMTDRYALQEHVRIFDISSKST